MFPDLDDDHSSKYTFEYDTSDEVVYKEDTDTHSKGDIFCTVYRNKKTGKYLNSYDDGTWKEFTKNNHTTGKEGTSFSLQVRVTSRMEE